MEPHAVINKTTGKPNVPATMYCPSWAGGDNTTVDTTVTEPTVGLVPPPAPPAPPALDSSWTMLSYTLGKQSSPNPHLLLTCSSPNPHLILTLVLT
jgi:hypothetical protein